MISTATQASQWTMQLFLGLLLLAPSVRTDGLAVSYCSPDNTAGSFQAVYNTWQTNEACQASCNGQYAYAILQGTNCWCSNYAPANQVSTYSCNTVCPGWPSEWCGNTAEDLFGYFQLDGKAPYGTAGAGGSSPTSGSSSSSPPPPSSSSSSSSPSSSASPSTTHATPTEVYTSVTTVTGQVRTVVVTPTPSSDSTLGSGTTINSNNNGGGGVSTGKVVGIVIGVALGIGLLIGLGVWFYFRRRNERNVEAASYEDSSTRGNNNSNNNFIPSRQVSQLSSAGLLGKAPRIQTAGLPSGSNPRSADTSGSNFDRRSLGTDQRLNPYAIYAHDESRHSNVSLQDNQDYSRQLRIANPDP